MSRTTKRAKWRHTDKWVIQLRGRDSSFMAQVDSIAGCFNTWKFDSYEAALAFCRAKSLNPIDYVIVFVRFPRPRVIATRDIDYGTSTVTVAAHDPSGATERRDA